jgi:hypothetical protein
MSKKIAFAIAAILNLTVLPGCAVTEATMVEGMRTLGSVLNTGMQEFSGYRQQQMALNAQREMMMMQMQMYRRY